MLRRVVICLTKTSSADLHRLWIGAHPHCCLWQSCVRLQANSKSDDGNTSSSSSSDSDSDSDHEKGGSVDQELKSAAKNVAEAIPGQGKRVQSDLLQQLQLLASQSKAQAKGDKAQATPNLADLLGGMKVMKREPRVDRIMERDGRTFQKGGMEQRWKDGKPRGTPQSIQSREKLKLFEGPGLGIFVDSTADANQQSESPTLPHQQSQSTEVSQVQRLSLWEKVQQEQLQLFTRQPPTNAFEEMIQLTEEGRLWTFPINNEQGMEDEAAVGFHEHVFLEDQIKDFPRRGPVRHFMELVIVGLSKNPYLTVKQKHEHIDWFRQYFQEKQAVLEEAFGEDGKMQSASAN